MEKSTGHYFIRPSTGPHEQAARKILSSNFLAPLVAAFVVLWARDHGSGTSDAQGPEDEPERILRRRFAAGEIDEHEFVDCLTTLRGAAR